MELFVLLVICCSLVSMYVVCAVTGVIGVGDIGRERGLCGAKLPERGDNKIILCTV